MSYDRISRMKYYHPISKYPPSTRMIEVADGIYREMLKKRWTVEDVYAVDSETRKGETDVEFSFYADKHAWRLTASVRGVEWLRWETARTKETL
ncbi:MAG: hypothetical protein NC114_10635, partial [Ruminococcus flavefaciens]|nr:hypothetical protein [Ruminococcus flavefaciens]